MTILAAVERANRIPDLGLRVHALCARWAERLPADVRLFVNLHPAPLAITWWLSDVFLTSCPQHIVIIGIEPITIIRIIRIIGII